MSFFFCHIKVVGSLKVIIPDVPCAVEVSEVFNVTVIIRLIVFFSLQHVASIFIWM